MDKSVQAHVVPIVNIIGTLTALGPVRRALLPEYYRWQNDADVNRTRIFTPRPLAEEAVNVWYDRISQQNNLDNPTFTIYERATWRPIGLTSFFDIDFWTSTAEYGIVIGEKDCWGKGYGTEVTSLMLAFGFRTLCLQQIHLHTVSFNERGIRAYTRAGFQRAGCLRHAHRAEGKACDVIIMDCLAADFISLAPPDSITERTSDTMHPATEGN